MSNVVMASESGAPGTADVQVRVGGVRDEHHVEWIRRSLSLGDTVGIRVVDTGQPDPPASSEPITNAERERLRIASKDNGG
jgi:desulfoferrodoxin (superoxide reductase-like protein)